MVVLKLGRMNVSSWKQERLRNDFRLLSLDVIAVSKTKTAVTRVLAHVFNDFKIFVSLRRPRMERVRAVFRKGLDLETWLVLLDQRKSVVLDVNDKEGSTFRLVVAYAPLGA